MINALLNAQPTMFDKHIGNYAVRGLKKMKTYCNLFLFMLIKQSLCRFCRSKGLAGSSAVCIFSMDLVEQAFNGRYKEVNRETQQWYKHTLSVPEPRPGMVRKTTYSFTHIYT